MPPVRQLFVSWTLAGENPETDFEKSFVGGCCSCYSAVDFSRAHHLQTESVCCRRSIWSSEDCENEHQRDYSDTLLRDGRFFGAPEESLCRNEVPDEACDLVT